MAEADAAGVVPVAAAAGLGVRLEAGVAGMLARAVAKRLHLDRKRLKEEVNPSYFHVNVLRKCPYLVETQRRDCELMLRVGVQASRRQYVCRERDGGTLLHVLACVGGRFLVTSASEVEISVS